jgi:nicotinamide riboside transporter PnuC
MSLTIIGFIAAFLGIAGAILNARQNINGFFLWVVSNLTMVAIGIHTHTWYNVLLFTVYTGISGYGIMVWRKGKGTK